MDLITTGVSASERMRRESLLASTRTLIMEKMQLGGASTRLLEVYLLYSKSFQQMLRSLMSNILFNMVL